MEPLGPALEVADPFLRTLGRLEALQLLPVGRDLLAPAVVLGREGVGGGLPVLEGDEELPEGALDVADEVGFGDLGARVLVGPGLGPVEPAHLPADHHLPGLELDLVEESLGLLLFLEGAELRVALLDLLLQLKDLLEHGPVVDAVAQLLEDREGAGAQFHEAGLPLSEQLVAADARVVHLLGEGFDLAEEGADALDVGAEVIDGAAQGGGGIQVFGELLGADRGRGDGGGAAADLHALGGDLMLEPTIIGVEGLDLLPTGVHPARVPFDDPRRDPGANRVLYLRVG